MERVGRHGLTPNIVLFIDVEEILDRLTQMGVQFAFRRDGNSWAIDLSNADVLSKRTQRIIGYRADQLASAYREQLARIDYSMDWSGTPPPIYYSEFVNRYVKPLEQ